MGQVMSYGLTQDDVDEVFEYCQGAYSRYEISGLYRRFRTLDRGRKGYITAEELVNIPELSINPLAQRLIRMFDGVNFMEFCRLLAPFSIRATQDSKVEAIFSVFDVDGDGKVSRDDLVLILRNLCGTCLSEDEIDALIAKAFAEAGKEDHLSKETFNNVFKDADLNMQVEIPFNLMRM